MEDNKFVLEVSDLHTTFKTDNGDVSAVNGVSFKLEPGKTLGIVGESGSGKSVTAYSIMQILAENGAITGGSVKYKGEDITKWNKKKMADFRGKCCSIIFQDPMTSLNPVFTVGYQLEEAVLLHTDRTKKEAKGIVGKLESLVKEHPIVLLAGGALIVVVLLVLMIMFAVKLVHRNQELDDLYDEYDIPFEDEDEEDDEPVAAKKSDRKAFGRKKVKDDDYDDGYDDDFNDDYDAFDDEYADYDFDDDYDDDYDDEYDAPTGNTRNLGRSAKKSKKGRKSDDYDVDFIDL